MFLYEYNIRILVQCPVQNDNKGQPPQSREKVLDLFKGVPGLCSHEELCLNGLLEESDLRREKTIEEVKRFLNYFIILVVGQVQQNSRECPAEITLELTLLSVILREGEQVFQAITGCLDKATKNEHEEQ